MEIRPEEIARISESPSDLFMRSLTVPATRRNYISSMKKIMCEFLGSVLKGDPDLVRLQKAEYEQLGKKNQKSYFDADFEVRINEFVHRTKADPGWAESVLIKLTQEFAKNINDTRNPEFRGLGTVANYLKMIKKLLQQNRAALNWDNVYSYLPTEEIREDTRGYTRQEIQKMLNHCHNAMDQVIVLLGASSGIRAGAFVLKWKHLKPVYQFKNKYYFEDHDMTESIAKEGKLVCAMIRIYAQSNAEYFAFITPECWNMIQEYRQKWIQDIGKEPIEEDAFFKQSGFVVRPLTKDGIEKRLLRVARDSGLRPPLKKGQRIHEIPLFNGLRRFFNKENKKSLTKNSPLAALILKETMMGHGSLIKLDKNYFKEHADELIEEYLQAVPNLTISDALQKEAENIKLRKKNFALENEKHKVTNLEQDLKSVHIILDEIQKRLEKKKN